MRQAYENIQKLLTQYGATLENVIDETLFVTDMGAVFAGMIIPALIPSTPTCLGISYDVR